MMIHKLKTWPRFFKRMYCGDKMFEIRKDDRDFQTGDTLVLEEWNPETETYTGNELRATVRYCLRNRDHEGVAEGYVAMSLDML